jgi:hypothetical protein
MNPSAVIDQCIGDLGDWRGPLSARLRTLILAADPDIKEEWNLLAIPLLADEQGLRAQSPNERNRHPR